MITTLLYACVKFPRMLRLNDRRQLFSSHMHHIHHTVSYIYSNQLLLLITTLIRHLPITFTYVVIRGRVMTWLTLTPTDRNSHLRLIIVIGYSIFGYYSCLIYISPILRLNSAHYVPVWPSRFLIYLHTRTQTLREAASRHPSPAPVANPCRRRT